MLARAEASWAGICDLVILGMVNAAMIKMMVITISSSMRVNPRSRFRLRMDNDLSRQLAVPWPRLPNDLLSEKENRGPMRANKQNYSSAANRCQSTPLSFGRALRENVAARTSSARQRAARELQTVQI